MFSISFKSLLHKKMCKFFSRLTSKIFIFLGNANEIKDDFLLGLHLCFKMVSHVSAQG